MSIRAVDVAYDCLQANKEGMSFKELWSNVKSQLGYGELAASRKISQFYTNLTLDGRFVELEDHTWNLKANCRYDKLAAIAEEYQEEETEEEEAEESEETEQEAEESEDEYDSGNDY